MGLESVAQNQVISVHAYMLPVILFRLNSIWLKFFVLIW